MNSPRNDEHRRVREIPFDFRKERWNDPESLEALEESNRIAANPGAYKHFRNAAELIADCLEGGDEE